MIEEVLNKELRWLARAMGHKAHPHHIDDVEAQIRVLGYQPRIDRDYQCPACWMRAKMRSNLDPIPTHTRDDALECDVCGASYLIPR